MNVSRINDLVSNLGWIGENNVYIPGYDCLGALERLEDELLNEDGKSRNVRTTLHSCGTVKNDLIPILSYVNDAKVVATATRVFVNLSLPMEYLLPLEESQLTFKQLSVREQLATSLLAIKKAFLDARATLSLVTILRDTMIKSEKHQIPLKEEDCIHLKNCLTLLRNILHLPDLRMLDKHSAQKYTEWQSVQCKLIWNLFVQGIDGALLLMLNSKYRKNWTVPLSLIIALLYRNQNIDKVHRALEQISSSSESSGDEESDGSKISSTSLSSEPSKCVDDFGDSGYPSTTEAPFSLKNKRSTLRQLKTEPTTNNCSVSEIHTCLEKVQISDHKAHSQSKLNNRTKTDRESNGHVISVHEEKDYESSSSYGSPYHKKIKANCSNTEIQRNETRYNSASDSAISMDHSSPKMNHKSSDEDTCEQAVLVKNLEAVQNLKRLQMTSKISESDSSNEDIYDIKVKYRSHPPTGRRGKSPRRNSGCTPAICMFSAYDASCIKGRVRYPLWEKRNSVSTLVDVNSFTPSEDDIGNLLKEFTLSFIHSGFSLLVVDIKNLLLEGLSFTIDKSLFFWIVSYFLPLATASSVCLEHICDILSVDVIGYLVFECANACESMEIHSQPDEGVMQYISVHLSLMVTALKEVLCAFDMYSRKCTTLKDRPFFNELYSKLAALKDLRLITLLLFRNCPKSNAQKFLEDVVVLNHEILIIIEKGSEHSSISNQINFTAHLKQFCTRSTIYCYGRVLENFKSNSRFLNDCVFTMLHHVAGDLHSCELLFVPSILKTFSELLKEDNELELYQEDLIVFTLNKFSLKVYQKKLKVEKPDGSAASCDSPSYSSVSSNCLLSEEDDLFWWYLQFQQDKEPICRISEHISTSKRDILSKLQLKGHISSEKRKQLEEKMKTAPTMKKKILPSECSTSNSNFDDEITHLINTLVHAGENQHIIWLQDSFLETCFSKLGLNTHQVEPIPSYCIKMMVSVPLIPYSEEQRVILHDETFLHLLMKLGLHLGSELRPMYPRIPLFWTTDMLFTIASRLGPIEKDQLKFTRNELLSSSPNCPKDTSCLPPLSSCCTLSSWLTAVQQNKDSYRTNQMKKNHFQ